MPGRYIRCPNPKCRTIIGYREDADSDEDNVVWLVRCPGKEKHERPEEFAWERRWKLTELYSLYYPETQTTEQVERYIGPPYFSLFFFAIICARRRGKRYYARIYVGKTLIVWSLSFHELIWSVLTFSFEETRSWYKRYRRFKAVVVGLLKQTAKRSGD